MTRINLVPVKYLMDQHLLAEHREIVRIPNQIKSGKLNGKGAPEKYVMGTGHVKFFFDKCGFLMNRYSEIYKECVKRGFHVKCMSSAFEGVPSELMNQYSPEQSDINISMSRIREKIEAKPGFYRMTHGT